MTVKRFLCFLIGFPGFVLSACMPVLADPPPLASVEVRVQLVTANGAALPSAIPVTLQVDRIAQEALTNGTGLAVFSSSKIETAGWFRVYFGQGFAWVSDNSLSGSYHRAIESLETTFSLPPATDVKVVPGQTTYDVTLTLRPGIVVTGKTRSGTNAPLPLRDEREGRPNTYLDWKPKGEFRIPGIPKDTGSLIFLKVRDSAGEKMVNRVLEISGSQAAQDVDLGTIVLDPIAEDCRLGVTVQGWAQRPSAEPPGGALLTLASADGQEIRTFVFDKATGIMGVAELNVQGRAGMCSGSWYMLPSSPVTDTRVAKALRLLRAGRSADLDQASIPKVVLLPNDAQDKTFDYWGVLQRVASLPSP